MARIRTIKPTFWTDEAVGECSPTARLLFVGSWNQADDHGNLERSAKQLKAQVFPFDSLDCEPLIQELISHGLLIEYEAEGKKYLHIKGFKLHQKIEKASSPRFPLYINGVGLPDPSPSGSGSSLGMEGKRKGRERKKIARARATPPTPIPEPIPPDGLNLEAWNRWFAYRGSIAKPIKRPSAEAAMTALAKFGADQAAVVEQSIANGWQGLFPLKAPNGSAGSGPAQQPRKTRYDQSREALERATEAQ